MKYPKLPAGQWHVSGHHVTLSNGEIIASSPLDRVPLQVDILEEMLESHKQILHLIADAGNTYQTIGKTPSELLKEADEFRKAYWTSQETIDKIMKENDKVIKALSDLVRWMREDHLKNSQHPIIINAEKALKNFKK